jgi:phage protein D
MAQKYHQPMWKLPDYLKDKESEYKSTISGNHERDEETKEKYKAFAKDKSTISVNHERYEETRGKYEAFAEDFLKRVETLDDE